MKNLRGSHIIKYLREIRAKHIFIKFYALVALFLMVPQTTFALTQQEAQAEINRLNAQNKAAQTRINQA